MASTAWQLDGHAWLHAAYLVLHTVLHTFVVQNMPWFWAMGMTVLATWSGPACDVLVSHDGVHCACVYLFQPCWGSGVMSSSLHAYMQARAFLSSTTCIACRSNCFLHWTAGLALIDTTHPSTRAGVVIWFGNRPRRLTLARHNAMFEVLPTQQKSC
jgi:hypothetical protein